MIRILKRVPYNQDGVAYYELAGNSLDTPPTEKVLTGSKYLETDTGRESRFDEETAEWYPTTNSSKTSIVGATVTLGSALTYNGNEQTQAVSSVAIGQTTLTVNTDYKIEHNKATLPGTYELIIRGVGNYVGMVKKAFTVAKGEGSVSVDPSTLSLTAEGDAGTAAVTVSAGDGAVTVASNHDDIASAAIEDTTVTVTPVAEGSATVTVTLTETDLYTGGTATIAVTVEAAADPDPDQTEGT